MKRKIIVNLILGLSAFVAYSQTDSAKVEYSQEKITKENKIDEAICDILTRREKSSKDLWKFNLVGTFLGGFDMAYERKLAPKWSLNIQSITNFSKSTYENGIVPADFFDRLRRRNKDFSVGQCLNFQIRHYYNLERRTRLGKKIGFSANYFGLCLNNQYVFSNLHPSGVTYSDSGGFSFTTVVVGYIHSNYFYHTLNLIYGIQRKIGKIGYLDGSIGIGLGMENRIVAFDYSGGGYIGESKGRYSSTDFGVSVVPKFGLGIAF